MVRVHFYTRKRCCLCDQALQVVRDVQRRVPFVLEIVDIERDPALTERYGTKIPVVTVDGRIHAKYRVDAARLERRLAAPSSEAA